ncbi:hydrogenase maturation nickel metallochaperone HypA [Glaciimonas sp. PCH181]|uniref:hydrogenase maturation nickel metallochaperone HypA/HybF n=1 Tax=Glaciimonas sp. PCH181 TaxID=2133943 RepID=UPI000D367150|nr:hydrogenase maturation nickel metallochaperone HypA [Glaciimonas sp. PCH181]PUA19135.1 hydrogenase maturation nickel metallochaperone HypA [Glaciimonas sp. PCH181]
MHEVSLAGGILKIVEDAAKREQFARVTLLRLEAGSLAGVEVRALRFALEVMALGTCLEGAQIEITTPPGEAWCGQCNVTVNMMERGDPCGHCGNYQLEPTNGMALRVIEIMVDDN